MNSTVRVEPRAAWRYSSPGEEKFWRGGEGGGEQSKRAFSSGGQRKEEETAGVLGAISFLDVNSIVKADDECEYGDDGIVASGGWDPLVRPGHCLIVRTREKEFLFEAYSEAERDGLVHGWKTVVARMASLIVVGDANGTTREFYMPRSFFSMADTWQAISAYLAH